MFSNAFWVWVALSITYILLAAFAPISWKTSSLMNFYLVFIAIVGLSFVFAYLVVSMRNNRNYISSILLFLLYIGEMSYYIYYTVFYKPDTTIILSKNKTSGILKPATTPINDKLIVMFILINLIPIGLGLAGY